MTHLAAIPLGPGGLFTVDRLFIDPLVVLSVKAETLLEPLFDV
jgi:hypothetical protein